MNASSRTLSSSSIHVNKDFVRLPNLWEIFHGWKRENQICTGFSGAGRRETNLVRILPRLEEGNPILREFFRGGKKENQFCACSSEAGRRKSNLVWVLPWLEEENQILCVFCHNGKKRNQICESSSTRLVRSLKTIDIRFLFIRKKINGLPIVSSPASQT